MTGLDAEGLTESTHDHEGSESLIEWIRAQVDTDERRAHEATEPFLMGDRTGLKGLHPQLTRHVYTWTPARVLAEVESKRRILAEHVITVVPRDPDRAVNCKVCGWCSFDPTSACLTLRALALAYRDREGYREEWG